MRASALLALFLCVAAARAADDPSSGRFHLAKAEQLAKEGNAYEAAREAQQAYWLDPSLKSQADALLEKVHGGKAVDPEFGPKKDNTRAIVLGVLGTFAILAAASGIRFEKKP
jgi:hypothetical protein